MGAWLLVLLELLELRLMSLCEFCSRDRAAALLGMSLGSG